MPNRRSAMRLNKVARIAWRDLAKNKLRSLLTMLGVIIGVAAVIIMVAISAGTEKTITERITGLGTNLIFITQNFSRGGPGPQQNTKGGLVYDDAFAIANEVQGVTAVVVEQESSQTVRFGDATLDDTEILGS